jgi:hypothetical protein
MFFLCISAAATLGVEMYGERLVPCAFRKALRTCFVGAMVLSSIQLVRQTGAYTAPNFGTEQEASTLWSEIPPQHRDHLRKGNWFVVIIDPDCDKCRKLLESLVRSDVTTSSERVMVISVRTLDPATVAKLSVNDDVIVAELAGARPVCVPTQIALRDGTIIATDCGPYERTVFTHNSTKPINKELCAFSAAVAVCVGLFIVANTAHATDPPCDNYSYSCITHACNDLGYTMQSSDVCTGNQVNVRKSSCEAPPTSKAIVGGPPPPPGTQKTLIQDTSILCVVNGTPLQVFGCGLLKTAPDLASDCDHVHGMCGGTPGDPSCVAN